MSAMPTKSTMTFKVHRVHRAIVGFVQHNNVIFPWAVAASGEVSNAIG